MTIVVVSWNLRALLELCLTSMRPEVEAGRAEVWVVDNASTDGSPELVRERFPWVKLIACERNLGYGPAVNLVARQTRTPWLAPANNDIELRPGALERLLHAGELHPEAGIVAPRLERPDGSTQHSVFPFPTLGVTLLVNLGLYRLSRRLADRLCIPGSWNAARDREVPWAIATFVLVRRTAFEAAGGFSPDQFMHSEDLDLGWRLSRAGWTSRFEPGATVFHVGSVASRRAFSGELSTRWMEATYGWMARERGVLLTWTIAAVNLAGAVGRWAFFGAVAPLAPARFGPLRDAARRWISAHRRGLRPRRRLVEVR